MRPWIDALLAGRNIDLAGGRVCILTFPRVLGFGFYPVSFWYCFHADGTPAPCSPRSTTPSAATTTTCCTTTAPSFDWDMRPTVEKVFSVSPFIAMDARYEFAFSEPGDRLDVSIRDFVAGPLLLTASLQLKAEPLTDENLSRVVRRYGPISARAWVLIHLQAIRIVSKGIPYIPPSPEPPEETT